MATPEDTIIIAIIRGSAQPNISWGGGSQLAVLKYNYLTGNKYIDYIPDDEGLYPVYEIGDFLQSQCQGTTNIVLTFAELSPYFNVEYQFNSPSCGYIAPTCDISISIISKTNCTTPDNNDGSVQVGSSSSYPVNYYLINGPTPSSNSTGIFTDLEPGDY